MSIIFSGQDFLSGYTTLGYNPLDSSIVFNNNCSSLTGWTNNGFSVSTKDGKTCFLGTAANNYIYINTGVNSLKGYIINFNVYLTGGCPDFFFACNSSGSGQYLRFEQRNGATNQNGFSVTTTWTTWPNLGILTSSYTWPQNTWVAVSISINAAGIATFSMNGVASEITYAIADNGGYIGIQVDGGGGSISVNNIIVKTNSINTFTFTSANLNIISWYNPNNVSSTSGVVTGWNDSLGNYNFTNYSGTINVVTYNGYNILYSPYISTTGPSLSGPNFTGKSLGGLLFGYKMTSVNQQGNYLACLFGNITDIGVRVIACPTNYLMAQANDLTCGANGAIYTNGLLVTNPTTSQINTTGNTVPTTVPTNYNIQYAKFSTPNQTNVPDITLFTYVSVRSFFGYLSDLFIVNTSFTTENQQVLEGYIAYKLGTQSKLPTNHPYYSATNSNLIIINPINTITDLKVYCTFDNAVNSTGGTYTSGTIYIPNLAPGSVNTSDTTGSLYKGWTTTNPSLSNTTIINGTNSVYNNGTLLRNSKSYTFPQNTGLTFTIWINMVQQTPYDFAGLFGFSNSAGTTFLALRLSRVNTGSNTGPWYLNYLVDNYITGGATSGGTTITDKTLNANTWYHCAWVISPALYGGICTYTFYVNGIQIKSISGANILYPSNIARTANDICAEPGNGSNKGYTDSFRFYERALTDSEILYIYQVADPTNVM